ncbi:MAG: hypothetical protein ACR652_24390 [Methylocystis sp.]|uniref:hypothetical protein n=1 Tax=Methylocystis sp. TaxID=1911079 RepID=UPI003DA25652
MIQSVTLSPAEAFLLKIEEERHKRAINDSMQQLNLALKSIYDAHGWIWGVTKGQLQRDPLESSVVRFVYDDGQPMPLQTAEVISSGPDGVPELKIVPIEAAG